MVYAFKPFALFVAVMLVVTGCSSSPPSDAAGGNGAGTTPAASSAANLPTSKSGDDPLPPAVSPYDALPEDVHAVLNKPFTGDFDEMVKRRVIRAGVVFNRTHYFIDKGQQRGISYESLRLFEDELNKRLKTGVLRVHVAIIPLARNQLFPALEAGKVDLVAATLTITPERQKIAAFSTPVRDNVSEIAVTSSDAAPVATPDDLSGRQVFVRRSSSYYDSLKSLNETLASRGKPPVTIVEAPEALEDDDVLEMVNAGLVDITIVDDYVAEFWQQVFPNLRPQKDVAVRSNGQIAVGVRKNNPRLTQAVNAWIKKYGPRTAFGNTMEHKYLQSTKYVKSAASEAERKKFLGLVKMFETYSAKYDVDAMLMAAQGFQESGLDQGAKSAVGAIGVMQVMPATGKDLAVGDITRVEPNIHAGVKYFRFMVDQFYKDEPMDNLNKGLMTLASYNAGPGRMRQLRKETAQRGLDPNVWFGNVENVVSERIGRETVQYVSNIYKYYVAYKLVRDRELERERAKEAVKKQL